MDTEKKSEEGWDEPEQLGPYQLQEQVPQSESGRGELYLATHETSGARALVLKLAAEENAVPPKDWKVRCVSSTAPSYIALEVEQSPWSVAPDKHTVETLVFTMEGVHEGVRRMARAFEAVSAPRPWWLGPALAAALALVLLPGTLAPAVEEQERGQEAWATDVYVDPAPVKPGEAPRPVRNQKRAPCTAGLEVELSGACWLRIENRPCPAQTVSYQGYCLLPVAVPRPPGTSLDGDGGFELR